MTETLWAPARRRGRPPASHAAITRERILRAAQQVFAESGYEAATFQAIAANIGLTRPAINNYFNCKSALYEEVVGRVSDALLDAIGVASAEPTLAGQILTFIRTAGRMAKEAILTGWIARTWRDPLQTGTADRRPGGGPARGRVLLEPAQGRVLRLAQQGLHARPQNLVAGVLLDQPRVHHSDLVVHP